MWELLLLESRLNTLTARLSTFLRARTVRVRAQPSPLHRCLSRLSSGVHRLKGSFCRRDEEPVSKEPVDSGTTAGLKRAERAYLPRPLQ